MSDDASRHVELDPDHEDRVVRASNRIIRHGVRLLSAVMVIVILLAIVDTVYLLG